MYTERSIHRELWQTKSRSWAPRKWESDWLMSK